MQTGRLEAFSDGVLAIIITIMVLNLKVPEEGTFVSLIATTGPSILTYLLSFMYVGIYWNNHHHTLQIAERVSGAVLWANLALLFVLSFLPFTTAWMEESEFSRSPVILYGANLLAAALSYFIFQTVIIRTEGTHSKLRRVIGGNWKGKASTVMYALGMLSALLDRGEHGIGVGISLAIYSFTTILWVIPDRRIDAHFRREDLERQRTEEGL